MTDFGQDKEWIEAPNDVSDYDEEGNTPKRILKKFKENDNL